MEKLLKIICHAFQFSFSFDARWNLLIADSEFFLTPQLFGVELCHSDFNTEYWNSYWDFFAFKSHTAETLFGFIRVQTFFSHHFLLKFSNCTIRDLHFAFFMIQQAGMSRGRLEGLKGFSASKHLMNFFFVRKEHKLRNYSKGWLILFFFFLIIHH